MPEIHHVILDRDGVINQETPSGFVETPDQWIWLPRVLESLSALVKADILISIASNQSCVGRGIIDENMLEQIHTRMIHEAKQAGVCFAGIYYCPHVPGDGCRCRKPMPGLLELAVRQSGISPRETIFIGDAEQDLQAGQSAGITTWLVRTGKGFLTESTLMSGQINIQAQSDILIFNNLSEACSAILSHGVAPEDLNENI
jgi:D-glycero-D-manno-heptose 1,7-bisphosphate phosphatase